MLAATRKGLTIAAEPSFFTVLWNQKFVVAAIIIVAAAIGFGIAMLQPETFEATATAVITDPNTAQELTDQMGLERNAARNTATQAAFMESLDSSIDTSIERETGIITITASAPTPSGPVVAIEAMMTEYSSATQAQAETAATVLLGRLDEQQATIEAEIAQLEADVAADPDSQTLRSQTGSAVNELRFIERNRVKVTNQLATYGDGVRTFNAPQRPETPSSEGPIRNAIVAAVLGLLVAVGVAWVRGSNN